MYCDVAIVGGGASGLALAALLSRRTKLNICVLEGGVRLGKKLAASGNGQGNVSNVHMSEKNYYGSGAARGFEIISRYGEVYKTLFHGLFTCDERGRVYPAGRQASSLSDSLIAELARAKVNTVTGVKVTKITKKGLFCLTLSDGRQLDALYTVLCVGGKAQKQFGTDGTSYALAQSFGHTLTNLYPSLVQLKTDTTYIKTLRGIRADCEVRAVVDEKEVKSSRGDVIFTEYGISGNAVFSVSPAFAGHGGDVIISFAPEFSEKQLKEDILSKQFLGYEATEVLALTLNNQIGRAIVKRACSSDAAEIASVAKNFVLPVYGTLGFDYAQVTRGGIDMTEVTDELESKLCRGLFFAGEVLDIDGDCGGYNLTWAFASAERVAQSIAERTNDKAHR